MKKHPGILFTLYTFFIYIMIIYLLDYFKLPHLTKDTIKILWGGMMVYGITYYHGKWIEERFEKGKPQ